MKRAYVTAQRGLSIIELLVYMTISSTVVAGIYQTFAAQQKSYQHQTGAAELQQNLRASLYTLTKDIHSAGYNPSFNAKTPPGFVTTFPAPNNQFTIDYATQKTIIAFTSDTNGNGQLDPSSDPNSQEMMAYRFNATNRTLERFQPSNTGGTWGAIADNVETVNFITLDRNGAVTSVANNIRAVEMAILVREAKPDAKFVNKEVYKNKQGTVLCTTCAGDNFHRRLLTTTVQARNLR